MSNLKKKIDTLDVLTTEFENHVLVVTPNKFKEFRATDGNVAVALAITANYRVRFVINNPLFKLLYTDIDSGFVEGELPSEFIDNKN